MPYAGPALRIPSHSDMVSDLLLLEIAMYRSWIIEQRGYDLDNDELYRLLSDTRASERFPVDPSQLIELLDATMLTEHRETLRSLRKKTGFDDRIGQAWALPTERQPS